MPIPESEILPYLYNSNNPGTKWGSSGLIPPRSLWKPVRQLMIADWLGLMESARGESFRSGQRRGPVALAEDKFYPRIINPSISLQLQQPADDKGEHRGRYRTARCANPFGAG